MRQRAAIDYSAAAGVLVSRKHPLTSFVVNPERTMDFQVRREFRSLSGINHPNLVGMQPLEVDGGQWFFTMNLVAELEQQTDQTASMLTQHFAGIPRYAAPEQLLGQRVVVTPLTEQQCLQFMANRVGISPEELGEQAWATFFDTKGNPYFLEQLIEGFNVETQQFEPVPLHELVERRLQQLPEDAADLLQVIAIAGQAVSVEEASRVAGRAARCPPSSRTCAASGLSD